MTNTNDVRMLYEFFVGRQIQRAARIRGAQPRHSIPPLLETLRLCAERLHAEYGGVLPRNGAIRLDLTMERVGIDRYELVLEIPNGIPDELQADLARLLGQRFLTEVESKQAGAIKKRNQARAIADYIAALGRAEMASPRPPRKWADLTSRVKARIDAGEGTYDDDLPDLLNVSETTIRTRLAAAGVRPHSKLHSLRRLSD